MRTSFHHQPEAQHPNFPLFTSWQADYPIFRHKPDIRNGAMRFAYCALGGARPGHRVGWMPSVLAMVAIWAR